MEMSEKPEAPPPLPHAHPLSTIKRVQREKFPHGKRLHADFLNRDRVTALEAQSSAPQKEEEGTLHCTKALWNALKKLEDAPVQRVTLQQHEKELAATKAVDWPECMPFQVQVEKKLLEENEFTVLEPRKVGKQVNVKYLQRKCDPVLLPRHPLMMQEEHSMREGSFATTFEDVVSDLYGCVHVESIKKKLHKGDILKEERILHSETLYFPPGGLGQPAALNAMFSKGG
uniref:AlNc14C30G2818 protein n=1 Tax=Albugo laibachii Nc14 TaxID=890382 RepID=F0W7L2_9STRA|nr:AlNc14C30G2818 [Albugo laibachii Nc14]|eukprot:CCA17113.1 AlNc14C30G2818 [Albugo laibachii Nc14]